MADDDAPPSYGEYLAISSISYQVEAGSVQASYAESRPSCWSILDKRVKDNLSYDGIKFQLKLLTTFTVYLLVSHLILEFVYKEYNTSISGEDTINHFKLCSKKFLTYFELKGLTSCFCSIVLLFSLVYTGKKQLSVSRLGFKVVFKNTLPSSQKEDARRLPAHTLAMRHHQFGSGG